MRLPRPPRKEASKEASKEAARKEAVRKEAAVVQVAAIDPPPPAAVAPKANVRDAIVDVLLETLGVRVARPAAAQTSGPASGPAPSSLVASANELLAALRVGRP